MSASLATVAPLPDRVRLHITPFTPELLERYIPPAVKSQASDISFHSIETFPEKGFGYVELPTMEAQKLKKKLNGLTLKGARVRIEEARPEKKKRKSAEAEDEAESKTVKKIKKQKQKREDGVIPGHELEEGRVVKRGWTEEKKSKRSSKEEKGSLKGKKMEFKTAVPPNAGAVKTKKADTKAKEKREKIKGGASKKAVVVKEFSKTTKPDVTGVKSRAADATYEVGTGWVDVEGNVVEAEPPSRKRKRRSIEEKPNPAPIVEPVAEQEDDSEPEVESSSEDESSVVSSSDESDDAQSEASTPDAASEEGEHEIAKTIADDTQLGAITGTEVHPLEALFKRAPPKAESAKKLAPIDTTSFSFFSGRNEPDDDADGEDQDVLAQPPQTPHTKADLQWRAHRSAAPTPDTAAIGKRFSLPFAGHDDDDEDEHDAGAKDVDVAMRGVGPKTVGEKGEESEFRKWFYENRGDLNRSWKRRRREEKKVSRQRENRRLGRKLA